MSQKYVLISNDGTIGFYDSVAHSVIPSGVFAITNEDYETFLNNQGSYIFKNIDGTATLISLTDVYVATDYGLTIKTIKSNETAPTGSITFTANPTAAELKLSFPAISGSISFSVDNIGAVGDTISAGGISISCASAAVNGSLYTVGTDVNETAANIVSCLNSNSTFSSTYKATSSNAVITILEVKKGNGSTPVTATCTGTITLTTGTSATSVKGYSTVIMNQKLESLSTTYTNEMEQIVRAYGISAMAGESIAVHTAELERLKAWRKSNQEAIINEQ
jgi:hypothetical protein